MPVVSALYWNLVDRDGTERVVDVFKGTGIEASAAQLGIGAWVVRGAIDEESTLEWHKHFIDSLTRIANRDGENAVRSKGK